MDGKKSTRESWTSKQRAAVVVALLRGETSPEQMAEHHGLTVEQLDEWKTRFLSGPDRIHDPRCARRLVSEEVVSPLWAWLMRRKRD